MSDITVRNIEFRFEDDIAFQWNPGSPACGNMANVLTFIAPAFERYFIRALREALPLITDEKLAQDVDLFCKQEGQHSKSHFAHIALLTKRYPGLEETRQQVMDSYDQLLKNNDLKFHMAYMANLELFITPLGEFLIANLEKLFGKSDRRIASFILWHFIEEFEHRSVAIDVYNHLYGDYFYRLKNEFVMMRHVYGEAGGMVNEGFFKHVPARDNSIPHDDNSGLFQGTVGRGRFLLHCLKTLTPWYDPDAIKAPAWVDQWFKDDLGGADMAVYYPAKPLGEL
jgi:predicted metal-dependent hydrolase